MVVLVPIWQALRGGAPSEVLNDVIVDVVVRSGKFARAIHAPKGCTHARGAVEQLDAGSVTDKADWCRTCRFDVPDEVAKQLLPHVPLPASPPEPLRAPTASPPRRPGVGEQPRSAPRVPASRQPRVRGAVPPPTPPPPPVWVPPTWEGPTWNPAALWGPIATENVTYLQTRSGTVLHGDPACSDAAKYQLFEYTAPWHQISGRKTCCGVGEDVRVFARAAETVSRAAKALERPVADPAHSLEPLTTVRDFIRQLDGHPLVWAEREVGDVVARLRQRERRILELLSGGRGIAVLWAEALVSAAVTGLGRVSERSQKHLESAIDEASPALPISRASGQLAQLMYLYTGSFFLDGMQQVLTGSGTERWAHLHHQVDVGCWTSEGTSWSLERAVTLAVDALIRTGQQVLSGADPVVVLGLTETDTSRNLMELGFAMASTSVSWHTVWAGVMPRPVADLLVEAQDRRAPEVRIVTDATDLDTPELLQRWLDAMGAGVVPWVTGDALPRSVDPRGRLQRLRKDEPQ